MTGVAFERFLRDVLIELGYDVEMTKASGDQGVDLIAEKGSARIAIQAKGYTEASGGNSAVQEVFAGKTHYRCNRCAVITNSRFTANARQLARSTGCDLIDGGQMEELIAGNIL